MSLEVGQSAAARSQAARRRSWLLEFAIVIAIAWAGVAVGSFYRDAFFRSGAPQELPQYKESGAAVALACGQGFIDTGYAPSQAVADFLDHKRDSITCGDLPAGLPPLSPNLTQGLYRYLMSTAALVWVLTGAISWSGLTPMFAAAYALTLVFAYGLFRCCLSRLMSVIATVALLVSAVHLGYLPYFHDYAKAPFILGLMLMMARLAAAPLTWRRAILFGAGFGGIMGFGFGFRNDLLINVLPWVAVVALCLPGAIRANLPMKAACLAISAIVFVVVAWPILAAYSRGSNTGHVALLGLMTSFDAPLGIGRSIYDFGYVYSDGFAAWTANNYTQRLYGHGVPYLTAAYDHAMVEYVLTIARNWPADIVARAYASTLSVLDDLPFGVGVYTNAVPYGMPSAQAAWYDTQTTVLRALHGTGAVAVAVSLLIVSATSLRTAYALLLLLAYFTGYPAVQFHVRHFFHLEFVAWGAVAFVIECTAVGLVRMARAVTTGRVRGLAAGAGATVVRVATFAVLALLTVPAPLLALRGYQSRHVAGMLQSGYLDVPREAVATATVPAEPGRLLVAVPGLWDDRDTRFETAAIYLIAEFSSQQCDMAEVPVTFRYEPEPLRAEMSHRTAVRLDPAGSVSTVLFPAYYGQHSGHFTGVELAAQDVPCLVSVSRMRRDATPPVWLDVTFSPNWKRAKLYQTIAKVESPSDGDPPRPALFANPPTLSIPARVRPTAFLPPSPEAEFRSPILNRRSADSFLIDGRPDTAFTQLLLIKGQQLPAGARIVARGTLRSGGLTLGLTRDGAWVTTVNVTAKGEFVAAVATTEPGEYAVVLANLPDRYGEPGMARPWPVWLPRLAGLAAPADTTVIEISMLGWLPPVTAATVP